MENSIVDRITPIIERYSGLVGSKFKDEASMMRSLQTINDLGLYSIPILEDLLSAAKRAKDNILVNDIPLLLAEYGLSEAVLLDGTEVHKELYTEVSQAGLDKELLARWLTDHGYASTIKDTLSFDKGTFGEDITEYLSSKGYSYTRDSAVHPQTLKKVIKDHLASGGEMPPEEAVKVSMFERAVIKAPKERKGF